MKTAGDKILRDVFLGFMRIHILHHAAEGPIFGVKMMDELKRHGYEISPGTLYPLLHSLEKSRLLRCKREVVSGKRRKYYRTTGAGNKALAKVRTLIEELEKEILNK